MLNRITDFSSSARGKWIVLALWVALGLVIPLVSPPLSEVTENDDAQFLPADAESTRALELASESFPSEGTPAIIVAHRDGGLTEADFQSLQRFDAYLRSDEAPDNIQGVVSVFSAPEAAAELQSPDGATTTILVNIDGDAGEQPFLDTIATIRQRADDLDAGASVYVSGPGGLVADLVDIFNRIDSLLLYVTIGLVLVLLVIIYRSPVVAFVPLIAVGTVFFVASGLGALGADRFGLPVNGQSRGIMTVLLFGAGTDYNLFISSRYREQLEKTEDKHDAIAATMRAVGRAIASSAGTILVAMLLLLLADLKSTQTLGPLLAVAVGVMLVAAVTLIPALLAVLGRFAFWPYRPEAKSEEERANEDPGKLARFWPWTADHVTARPVVFLAVSILVFALLSSGLLRLETTYDTIAALPEDAESRQGFEVLRQSFPAGTLAPTEVFIDLPPGTSATDRLEAIGQVSQALVETDGIASVRGPANPFGAGTGPGPADVEAAAQSLTPETRDAIAAGAAPPGDGPESEPAGLYAASRAFISADGSVARLEVVLQENPYSIAAIDRIDDLRETATASATDAGLEGEVLVGGPTAVSYDTRTANNRDFVVLTPLILLAVGVILAWLLHSLIAPLYLVATIVLSNAATIGLAVFVFQDIWGDNGIGAGVPFYVFVFLVALGIDYNIYLMSRIREEVATEEVHEGARIALAKTGGVITSAGVILAGTFAALMTLPLRELYQIGFAVSVGVLIDTLISRSLIVPAVVVLLGRWNWWPSSATRAGEPGRAERQERSRSGRPRHAGH